MATNPMPGSSAGSSGPAANAAAVTPSDSSDLTFSTRALFIGGAGNVSVNMATSGAAVVFAVGAGQILPIQVARVLATGTTATGIVALW